MTKKRSTAPAKPPLPTRERIVRTAARLFLARSYQVVGVNEICDTAQVQKGSFYHFFPSKSDLAIAVIDHHAAALWAVLDEVERGRRGPINKLRANADAVGDIQAGLHRYFGRIVGCPLGNLAVELTTTEDAAGLHVRGVFQEWERRVASHCQDADEVGLLRAGVDPDALAKQMMATMQGMILLAKVSGSGPTDIPLAMHRVIDSGLQKSAA
jgi:TetR/AcrR family transcriptional repressor of nem operon